MENQEVQVQEVKIGDKVTFTPNKKSDRAAEPIIGVITKVFVNKQGKNYCSIKTNSKSFFKQVHSVTVQQA